MMTQCIHDAAYGLTAGSFKWQIAAITASSAAPACTCRPLKKMSQLEQSSPCSPSMQGNSHHCYNAQLLLPFPCMWSMRYEYRCALPTPARQSICCPPSSLPPPCCGSRAPPKYTAMTASWRRHTALTTLLGHIALKKSCKGARTGPQGISRAGLANCPARDPATQ
eukprot:3648666-Amphidinium_carterae.1